MNEETKIKLGNLATKIATIIDTELKNNELDNEEIHLVLCMLPLYFVGILAHINNSTMKKTYKNYLDFVQNTMELAIKETKNLGVEVNL